MNTHTHTHKTRVRHEAAGEGHIYIWDALVYDADVVSEDVNDKHDMHEPGIGGRVRGIGIGRGRGRGRGREREGGAGEREGGRWM
jgi:hypothetical protein